MKTAEMEQEKIGLMKSIMGFLGVGAKEEEMKKSAKLTDEVDEITGRRILLTKNESGYLPLFLDEETGDIFAEDGEQVGTSDDFSFEKGKRYGNGNGTEMDKMGSHGKNKMDKMGSHKKNKMKYNNQNDYEYGQNVEKKVPRIRPGVPFAPRVMKPKHETPQGEEMDKMSGVSAEEDNLGYVPEGAKHGKTTGGKATPLHTKQVPAGAFQGKRVKKNVGDLSIEELGNFISESVTNAMSKATEEKDDVHYESVLDAELKDLNEGELLNVAKNLGIDTGEFEKKEAEVSEIALLKSQIEKLTKRVEGQDKILSEPQKVNVALGKNSNGDGIQSLIKNRSQLAKSLLQAVKNKDISPEDVTEAEMALNKGYQISNDVMNALSKVYNN